MNEVIGIPSTFIYAGLLSLIVLLLAIISFLIRGWWTEMREERREVVLWLKDHEKRIQVLEKKMTQSDR